MRAHIQYAHTQVSLELPQLRAPRTLLFHAAPPPIALLELLHAAPPPIAFEIENQPPTKPLPLPCAIFAIIIRIIGTLATCGSWRQPQAEAAAPVNAPDRPRVPSPILLLDVLVPTPVVSSWSSRKAGVRLDVVLQESGRTPGRGLPGKRAYAWTCEDFPLTIRRAIL